MRQVVYKERLYSLRYRIWFQGPRVYTLIRCRCTHTCFVHKQRRYKVAPWYCGTFVLVYSADTSSHIVGIKRHLTGELSATPCSDHITGRASKQKVDRRANRWERDQCPKTDGLATLIKPVLDPHSPVNPVSLAENQSPLDPVSCVSESVLSWLQPRTRALKNLIHLIWFVAKQLPSKLNWTWSTQLKNAKNHAKLHNSYV